MPLTVEACYLLRPATPLRFGGHPEDLGTARPFPASDTLFGALTWAVLLVEGEGAAAAWVERFRLSEPPLLLSSALPYLPKAAAPLLPRPQRRPAVDWDAGDGWDPKVLKRVEYVDAALLGLWRGAAPAEPPVPRGTALLAAGRAGNGALWATAARPGVTLDRRTSASQVYTVAATSYQDCLPAVYVLAASEKELTRLERLLDILGRAGIGGRRSRGFGGFTWERVTSPLPLSPRPVGLALSLVWPRRDELEAGALSPPQGLGYRIVERHGWIASPPWATERGRAVAMLGEGSYLNPELASPVGGLADVTPAERRGRHPVYRYGLGLFLDEERLP